MDTDLPTKSHCVAHLFNLTINEYQEREEQLSEEVGCVNVVSAHRAIGQLPDTSKLCNSLTRLGLEKN